jgi:hypothetical protein
VTSASVALVDDTSPRDQARGKFVNEAALRIIGDRAMRSGGNIADRMRIIASLISSAENIFRIGESIRMIVNHLESINHDNPAGC